MNIIRLNSQDGAILFQLPQSSGVAAVSAVGVISEAEKTVDESLEVIKTVASAVNRTLRDLGDKVKTVKIEFGLTLNAKGNMIVVQSEVEASLKISLELDLRE